MAEGYSSDMRGQVEPTGPTVRSNALLIALIVVAVLYVGREVFVPIALAILLSFVLAVPVRLLQKSGVWRSLSVAIVVVLAFAGILTLAGVVTSQLAQLAGELPRYQTTIRDKISALKDAAGGHGPVERVADMLQNLSKEMSGPTRPTVETTTRDIDSASALKPIPVEIVGSQLTPLQAASAVVLPLLHPLALTGLIAVFVIFILMQRLDLRNRLIRLAGSHDLQRTTAAMNDAAERLSRFFTIQVLLNSAFGIVVGVALWLIGVPSPVLWGILAAISRFIPYIGVVIAAGGPLVLSAAVDPNWAMLVQTAIMFAVIELLVGQVVEPLLYGHSTGLSPVAVIVSVTFWTWLWGGVGLLLATPLTVCLVVLGRHIEQLQFLEVMFGDRPPLTAAESFYQRMLAGDAGEGLEQAEVFLRDHSLAAYYDEVAIKGLALAQVDASRGVLDAARLARVEETISALVEELSDHDDAPSKPDVKPDLKRGDPPRADGDAALDESLGRSDELADLVPVLRLDELREDWQAGVPVLCIAGRNQLDRAGAQMLAHLLEKHGVAASVEGPETLSSGKILPFDTSPVRMVVLSFLDTSTPVHVRYAVRRLKRRLPNVRIVVGSWGLEEDGAKGLCEAARSDGCVTRLADALAICIEAARRPQLAPVSSAESGPGKDARAA